MTTEHLGNLEEQLIRHEGIRLKPYRCSLGFLTIAVGYNIDARGLGDLHKAIGRTPSLQELHDRGLTEAEARKVLSADLRQFIAEIVKQFPLFHELDDIRQMVVVDFVFNLGTARAAKFVTAIRFLKLAVKQTDPELREACFTAVAFSMANSLWAQQVDDGLGRRFGRADRLAYMMRTGKFSPK